MSRYCHTGQTAPCAIYPKKTAKFSESICAAIVIGEQNNFTLLLDQYGPLRDRNVHSILADSQHIDQYGIDLWKSSGTMVSQHHVQLGNFGYAVLYDNKYIKLNSLAMKGIPVPFPWWMWISIATIGYTILVSCYHGSKMTVNRGVAEHRCTPGLCYHHF